jgi:geranylgeranyl diphosphate synthase type II
MQLIKKYQTKLTVFFKELLISIEANENISPELSSALQYVLLQEGQKIRSSLLLYLCDELGVNENQGMIAAAALELIHNYSLVHDDLPGMDNDLIRRGLPTCHVKFGEGIAILTGNALLTLAMQLLVDGLPEKFLPKVMNFILEAIGVNGLLSGQALDLRAKKHPIEESLDLVNLYYLKTGRLFELALAIPALLADLEPGKQEIFREAGSLLGILYQLSDDINDKDLALDYTNLKNLKTSLLDAYNGALNKLSLSNLTEFKNLIPIEKLLFQI